MRARMSSAVVGDSVYDEDPTVIELERRCAKLVGKDQSLFLPSATMSNLAAILAHCRRGDRTIVGSRSHIFLWEQGGVSSVAGCMMHPLQNDADGGMPLDELKMLVPPGFDDHWADTRLVCLENTHGGCGGVAIPGKNMQSVVEACRKYDVPVHLDGARLFNASVALDVPVSQLAEGAASVTVCLSKGLGAPMGSLLCAAEPVVGRAKRARKLLGGALRQAGIVAAAGLEALETYPDRLRDDHRRGLRDAGTRACRSRGAGLGMAAWLSTEQRAQHGAARSSTEQHGAARSSTEQHGAARSSTEQHGVP
jgi:threonine aldolase